MGQEYDVKSKLLSYYPLQFSFKSTVHDVKAAIHKTRFHPFQIRTIIYGGG